MKKKKNERRKKNQHMKCAVIYFNSHKHSNLAMNDNKAELVEIEN
jgi:hypothetical protein